MANSSEDERVESRDDEMELDSDADSGDELDASSGQEEEEEADLQALLEARAQAAAQRHALRERTKKVFANDVDALESKRNEIVLRIKGVSEPIPFLETLSVTSAAPLSLQEADDDLEREKAFYTMALANLAQAQGKLGGTIPFKRPEDYFAPMLKNDEHMTRVRTLLLKEKKRGEDAAMKRKAKEGARFQKQVSSERAQQRGKAKQAELDAIKKWRTQHKRSADDEDFPAELLDPNSELRKQLDATGELTRKPKRAPQGEADGEDARKKGPSNAALKAKKYGFGGKKGKHSKNPNAESFGEADKEWNARRNRTVAPEFRKYGKTPQKGGKGAKPSGGGARPGKRQRQTQGSAGGRPTKRPRRE